MNQLTVTLLGTGIPDPKPNRYGSGTLVEAGGEAFIFDCGRCVLQRLSETGTPIKKADKVFLTHLHSDHTVGIPDLWLTPWIFGRWERPFRVWGPKGTLEMMTKIGEAFQLDLELRPAHDLLPLEGARIETREFEQGVVYDNDGVTVTAFEVDHRPVIPSYGFRIDYQGKSVVLSGDTRYSENLIDFSKGADLVFHNVAAARPQDLEVSERYRKITALHASPEQAGDVFTQIRPKLAVYTHMALFKVGTDELIRRTRETYDGPLEIGEDLMRFEIGDTVRVIRPEDLSGRIKDGDIVPPL